MKTNAAVSIIYTACNEWVLDQCGSRWEFLENCYVFKGFTSNDPNVVHVSKMNFPPTKKWLVDKGVNIYIPFYISGIEIRL